MAIPDAVGTMEQQLRGIFGTRLQSLVLYGHRAHERQQAQREHDHAAHGHDAAPLRTLAVVDTMTPDDLRACAKCVDAWHDAGLATPLLVAARELEHSLDAFPLEFGAILADHTVVSGGDPFASLTIDAADVRRACEVQARSHLLHLREGFLETRGRSDALADLIVQSAAAFAALVASVARLEGHANDDRAAAARHEAGGASRNHVGRRRASLSTIPGRGGSPCRLRRWVDGWSLVVRRSWFVVRRSSWVSR
jgi:hypothetical protein